MSKIPSEKINELDFSLIRENLMDFVRNNSDFSDYDFEASGLNFVADLLAYNTQYNSFYLNQVASEMFLDTAQQRKNVVSIAKQMGYLANSKKMSKAILNMRLLDITGAQGAVNLPAGSRFSGKKINGETHPFVTTQDYVFSPINGFSLQIDLTQGISQQEEIVVNRQLLENRFLIASQDIDIETLNVYVKPNRNSQERTRYTRMTDITLLTEDSEVYYLEENFDGYYQVSFGDGILGKKILNNMIIELNYMTTAGAAGNDCVTFSLQGNPLPTRNLIQTVQFSAQGDDKENVEAVRQNARQMYFSQNRSVTEDDYSVQIRKYFPYIDSISVWGGEKNEIPMYGNVYLALKPKGRNFLTETEKTAIMDRLNTLNVISIKPQIIDPEYTYIRLFVDIVYDITRIEITETEITELVIQSASRFAQGNLLRFYKSFQVTALSRLIDGLEDGFLGTSTRTKLYQTRKIVTNSTQTYKINFNNKLKKGSFQTNEFNYFDASDEDVKKCSLQENTSFTALEIRTNDGHILVEDVGRIDYASGLISIEAFAPTYIFGETAEMEFEVEADSYMITPTNRQILMLLSQDINVAPVAFYDNKK